MMSAALLLCILAPAAAVRGSIRGSAGLLSDMRPEVVSKLLGEVSHKWAVDFVAVLSNTTDEAHAYGEMEKSCLKVSKSIIAGSDGDEDRVSEYMKEVCEEPSSSPMCAAFASAIDDAMVGDEHFNRERLDLTKFCKKFWNSKVQTTAQEMRVQQEAEEKAAAEKKAQEEKEAAEKKAAEEKAIAEKKAAEEKAAGEKKEADEKVAAEKKEADEKATAEKKAADEEEAKKKHEADEAAAEAKRAADSKAAEDVRVAVQAKTENLTAAIAKAAQDQEVSYNATEDDVHKLVEHAQQAIKLAAKKEADAVQNEKEEKAAKAAALKNATVTKAANETVPPAVSQMVDMNLTKEDAAAKAAGDEVAAKIAAKATTVTKKA